MLYYSRYLAGAYAISETDMCIWVDAELNMQRMTGIMNAFVLLFFLCTLFIPVEQVCGYDVFQNFDNIPATGENKIPADGDDWVYSSRKTNPELPPAAYDRCGWSDTNTYHENNIFDSMTTSGVGSNTPRRYFRYQYLEIDGENSVVGNSLKQVITGGYYAMESECGRPVQNKESFLEFQDQGVDPVCRDDVRVGYPYIYIVNSSLSHRTVPFEDPKDANRFSMYIKLPDSIRNGPTAPYNLVTSTINLGP